MRHAVDDPAEEIEPQGTRVRFASMVDGVPIFNWEETAGDVMGR